MIDCSRYQPALITYHIRIGLKFFRNQGISFCGNEYVNDDQLRERLRANRFIYVFSSCWPLDNRRGIKTNLIYNIEVRSNRKLARKSVKL